MSTCYNEINNEVNKLAFEMVKYNPDDINNTYVKERQNAIAIKLLELYERRRSEINQYGDEVRKIRVFNKGKPIDDMSIPYDIYTMTLSELLGRKKDGSWNFNHEKGTFTTAFHFKLLKKRADYYENKDEQECELSYDSDFNTKSYIESEIDKQAEVKYEDICNKWSAFAIILEALSIFTEKLERLPNKEQGYYEGFFTFDRTRDIKSDDELGKIACKHSGVLFPYMVVTLLEYLMVGNFSKMHDICSNPLRDGVLLTMRGALLEGYFGCSHPTLNKYSQKYDQLWAAIANETSTWL